MFHFCISFLGMCLFWEVSRKKGDVDGSSHFSFQNNVHNCIHNFTQKLMNTVVSLFHMSLIHLNSANNISLHFKGIIPNS